jgi:rare lipoprotein A
MKEFIAVRIRYCEIIVNLCLLLLLFGNSGCSCCCLSGIGSARVQYGMGSYYGTEFHGKKTASGEVFNKWDYTCAHKKLPFGTRLRVTNLKTNESVVVRVNDRGPFVKGRIIDLSYAAAKKIDMIKDGVIKVKIEIVE